MKSNRDNFTTSFGVLVAMAGSAIGLGNLWRFPYLVGTNGGAAFIIIYLIFVFVLCLPILISEFVVGRKSQTNVFRAFKILKPEGKWEFIGILAVASAICILAFYSVVGGLVCQLSCQGTYLQTSYRWRICHKHVQQYGDILMGTPDIHVDIFTAHRRSNTWWN